MIQRRWFVSIRQADFLALEDRRLFATCSTWLGFNPPSGFFSVGSWRLDRDDDEKPNVSIRQADFLALEGDGQGNFICWGDVSIRQADFLALEDGDDGVPGIWLKVSIRQADFLALEDGDALCL